MPHASNPSRGHWGWLLAWAVLCGLATLWFRTGLSVTGDIEGLIPEIHRSERDRAWVMLWIPAESPATSEDLLLAALAAHEAMGDRWAPIGAPAHELAWWLDTHALALMPTEAHEDVRRQLRDVALTDAVTALRARLSSPFFNLVGEEPRRDPLGLRERAAATIGIDGMWRSTGARVTDTGDLLDRRGRALLMLVLSESPEGELAVLDELARSRELGVALVGYHRAELEARDRVGRSWRSAAIVALAGLAAVLALWRRSLWLPLVDLVLASGVLLAAAGMTSGVTAVSFPILVALLLAVVAAGMGRRDPSGPMVVVLATALLPLWLTPYPALRAWAFPWFIAALLGGFLVRWGRRPIAQWFGEGAIGEGAIGEGAIGEARSRRPAVPRWLAFVCIGIAIAVGAMAVRARDPVVALEVNFGPWPDEQERFVRDFFDPAVLVRATSLGSTRAEAMERASVDARTLMKLVPTDTVAVSGPGLLVLPQAMLVSRQRWLAELDLPDRVARLRGELELRGFRSDAFGEVLHGPSTELELPSAAGLLESPLVRWVEPAIRSSKDGHAVTTWLDLHRDGRPLPVVIDDTGRRLELRGPAIAREQVGRSPTSGVFVALLAQLWIGMLIVWLIERDLPCAWLAGLAGGCTSLLVLGALTWLGIEGSPGLLPALLLISAMAMGSYVAFARHRAPRAPFELAATGGIFVVGGLALASAELPAWQHFGLALAAGGLIAPWFAGIVIPNLGRREPRTVP